MSLKFGIFDSFDLSHDTPEGVLSGRLEFAEEAERAGFDHYHVTEHHGTPLSVCPSPNIFIAALSRTTTVMRLGALVNVLPSYEPFRLAEEIATLDQLTHGRLDFGVGAGISPIELGIVGVEGDRDHVRALYQETLTAVTNALGTGRMKHTGKLLRDYDAQLSILPFQKPYPQLWYASGNAASAEWAGSNGINFVGRWESGAMTALAETYWDAWQKHRDEPGRLNPQEEEPRLGISGPVVIGESEAHALDLFHRAHDLHEQRILHLWHENDDHRLDGAFSGERLLAAGNAVVGTVDSVRDQLVAQVETSGINYLEMKLLFGDIPVGHAAATARTVMTSIAPAARAAARGSARHAGARAS
ncbi:LLM class flavin-dependent oxidoreductase [Streptomyces sp. NPDC026672]|uniref:LLM class flavin-dependent oxidoreductase n=1 Tax=unclassified Streptomyces TaxID=2593676 RepID=UPI0033D36B80